MCEENIHWDMDEMVCFDDASGDSLNPDMGKEARSKEVEYFKEKEVYVS